MYQRQLRFSCDRESGVFKGKYHVLHGKFSPIRGIGPKQLNLDSLVNRLENNNFKEVILALGNDMEGSHMPFSSK